MDGAMPYAIPPDNPFVGRTGLDEIYAYGFRNPYRMSFDMGGSHRLFLGDAGQALYEEVGYS
jgi:glucose/arabinose dehydrogenase